MVIVDADDNKYAKVGTQRLPAYSFGIIILLCFGCFGLVIYMDSRLPTPVTLADISTNNELHGKLIFIEERARKSLRTLTSVGHRPSGSYENEVLAVEFLKQKIREIMKLSHEFGVHVVHMDVQKCNGSFNLDFLDGFTHHYSGLQNVIVKLDGTTNPIDENIDRVDMGTKNHSLLLNCHFDSVPQSPGASDDAVSCAIMLEILETIVVSKSPIRHSIVFLFNGGEENMLPASHGFISQHKWAADIRVYINLEATGSGGREVVFQNCPMNPWLIEAYAKVAPYPFASVVGHELFQTGIIPGETDFRIFRDYGHIPGLDIAYVKNGYVYHTAFDTEDLIPAGSVQRAGDNVLALVYYLVTEAPLGNMAQTGRNSGIIYFDLLGVVMVHYSELAGKIVNLIVVLTSIYLSYLRVRSSSFNAGVSSKVYLRQMGFAFFVQLIACLMSFAVVIMIAVLLDALDRSMSWYSKPYLIVPLYVIPTVFSVTAVFNFALPHQQKLFQYVNGIWQIESLYFEVSKLVWTLITVISMLFNLKSSFISMLWVLFPMIGRFVLNYVYDGRSTRLRSLKTWMTIHLTSLVPNLLLSFYLIYSVFVIFIPIMGRAGSFLNPDLLIGCKTCIFTLATMSYLCGLSVVIKKMKLMTSFLYIGSIVSIILVVTTSLGFPYSIQPGNIAPQRSFIVHTNRYFYHKNLSLHFQDVGYFFINVDRHSPSALMASVPELKAGLRPMSLDECEQFIHCGVPMYYPASSLLRINHFLPTPDHDVPASHDQVGIKLLHTQRTVKNGIRLLFSVQGTDHTGINFSPVVGVIVKTWSLAGGHFQRGPMWKDNRPTFYIFHSNGGSNEPWEFWIELEVRRDIDVLNDQLIDLVVVGHNIHGQYMKSNKFQRFLAQFPSWSYPVGWSAVYKTYKF